MDNQINTFFASRPMDKLKDKADLALKSKQQNQQLPQTTDTTGQALKGEILNQAKNSILGNSSQTPGFQQQQQQGMRATTGGFANNCQSCGYPPQQTMGANNDCSWCGVPLAGATTGFTNQNIGLNTQPASTTGLNELNAGIKGINLENEKMGNKLGGYPSQSEINRV